MKLGYLLLFILLLFIQTLIFNEIIDKFDMSTLLEFILYGLFFGLIFYLIRKNRYFEKEISINVGCGIMFIIPIIIFIFLIVSSQTTVNIEDLSYEEIINHSYGNTSLEYKVDEIFFEKIYSDNEAIVFFLNKEHTISLARITKINNKWKAVVSIPPDRIENEPISWSWALLDNSPIEDKSQVASVMWGYIYSPDVAKIYVGSYKIKSSFQEAQIREFSNYNIKLYYFLSGDKIGSKQNTVVAYNTLGDVLYSNRNY